MKLDKAVVAAIIMIPESQATGFLFLKGKKGEDKRIFIAHGSHMFDVSNELYVRAN